MRWMKTELHDTRRRSGFLLLPKCIRKQWRWLEMATWSEAYRNVWSEFFRRTHKKWVGTYWLDKEAVPWETLPESNERVNAVGVRVEAGK